MKNIKIGTSLIAAFSVLVVIVIALAAVVLTSLDRMSTAVNWNNHTYEVLAEAEDMMSAMVDQETGVRGYLVSGDEGFCWSPTTALPAQDYAARGILDIRGQIVEVYDTMAMLGVGSSEGETGQVVLIVALEDRIVGLLVDSVSDIIDAGHGDFAEPPKPGGKVATIIRQNDRLISVLDLSKLFA